MGDSFDASIAVNPQTGDKIPLLLAPIIQQSLMQQTTHHPISTLSNENLPAHDQLTQCLHDTHHNIRNLLQTLRTASRD